MPGLHAGIKHISIRNFRGIEQLDLSFEGPGDYPTQVAVLGGPNGCGKTAVLEACLLASGHEKLIRGKSGPEAVRLGCDDYQIDVVVQVQSKSWGVCCTSRGKGQRVVPFAYFSSWRAPQLIGALDITSGRRGKRPAKTEENRLWNIKQFFVNARAFDFFPSQGSDAPSLYAASIRKLNHVWTMFFPDQSFTVEPVSKDPDDGFDVFLQTPHHDRLSVDSLSSGQLELFMYAGGLIVEDFPRGVIVIDEPELHLDPQWHRQVLQALVYLKPECQVLVATHSPEVYDSVRSFERAFLVPEDDPRAQSWQLAQATEGDDT